MSDSIKPGPQNRQQWSAPVPGRSKPGLSRRDPVFQGLFGLSHCCDRGRAHSAFVMYSTVSSVTDAFYVLDFNILSILAGSNRA